MVIGWRQAGRITDGTVDIADHTAGPADHVMVVVTDARFVTGHRTGRLNAPHQPGCGQRVQNVVDRLARYLGQAGTNRSEDGVGVGVRVGMDCLKHRDARAGDPQLRGPQLVGKIRHRGHGEIVVPFLESVKSWPQLNSNTQVRDAE